MNYREMFRERILPNDWGGSATKLHGKTGSHLGLTTSEGGRHHVTIPNHHPLKVGTLAGIFGDVAAHFRISRDELIQRLWG